MIKCDASVNIIEKHGFASEKNLILKDFYITIQQLVEFRKGILGAKTGEIRELLMQHLDNCKRCDLQKVQCEICMGGVLFYEYEIEKAGECNLCNKKGHLKCLHSHTCNALPN